MIGNAANNDRPGAPWWLLLIFAILGPVPLLLISFNTIFPSGMDDFFLCYSSQDAYLMELAQQIGAWMAMVSVPALIGVFLKVRWFKPAATSLSAIAAIGLMMFFAGDYNSFFPDVGVVFCV